MKTYCVTHNNLMLCKESKFSSNPINITTFKESANLDGKLRNAVID